MQKTQSSHYWASTLSLAACLMLASKDDQDAASTLKQFTVLIERHAKSNSKRRCIYEACRGVKEDSVSSTSRPGKASPAGS